MFIISHINLGHWNVGKKKLMWRNVPVNALNRYKRPSVLANSYCNLN